MNQNESNVMIEIDFQKCLNGIKKHYRLILLVAFFSLVIGTISAFFLIRQKNVYKATATVYGTVYGSNDVTSHLKMLAQYSDIVKSYKVAERAEVILGDASISKYDIYQMINASYDNTGLSGSNSYTSKIYISASSTDSFTATRVANATAEAFILEIGSDQIQILDNASRASVAYNAIDARLNLIFGFVLLGLFCSAVFVALREALSAKMFIPKDATAYGTLDIIGVIPDFKN